MKGRLFTAGKWKIYPKNLCTGNWKKKNEDTYGNKKSLLAHKDLE